MEYYGFMKNILIGGAFVLIGIAGAWWYISSSQQAAPAQTSETPAVAATTTKTFDLVVENRAIISGPTTLSVNEGDTVTINITVDEDEELHLHGYDKSIELEKGVPGSLTFEATASGRFPFELEHSKTDLGAVEVAP